MLFLLTQYYFHEFSLPYPRPNIYTEIPPQICTIFLQLLNVIQSFCIHFGATSSKHGKHIKIIFHRHCVIHRSSKSLLANVLDIDDDFRHNCRPLTPGGTLPLNNPPYFRTVFRLRTAFFCIFTFADVLQSSINLLVPLPYRHDDNCSIGTIGGNRMPDAIAPHACSFSSSADYELSLILKEIRFITDQVSGKHS